MKFKLIEDWLDSYKKNIKENSEALDIQDIDDHDLIYDVTYTDRWDDTNWEPDKKEFDNRVFGKIRPFDGRYEYIGYSKYSDDIYIPSSRTLDKTLQDLLDKLVRLHYKMPKKSIRLFLPIDANKSDIDEAFDDDDFSSNEQEFSSANTSINSSKLPAVFNKVKFKPGTINLDYGGGKFDNATEFLAQQDVTNLIFDKFNRSEDHNRDVIKKVRQNGGADTATCSNVLNVIKERDIRVNEVIKNIRSMLKPGGTAYFTVYEGTGAGDSRETKAGYQLNKKTADYVEEIAEIFGDNNVSRKGSVIVARK